MSVLSGELLRDEGFAREIERRLCEARLSEFVRAAWGQLEPGAQYVHGRVIEAVCEHLEAIASGELTRLLINIPPGSSKSLTASVFFPAWLWGPRAQPEMRFLTASHSEKFATRDARKMRDLVKSEWFRGRWPIELVREGETSFANSATGFREAMPFRSLTGARGDILIIDDPHSTETAESEAERLRTERIFRESIPTRLNDPSRSAIIVIMQRLHERDVSGIALEMGYEHLMLPMEFDPGRKCVTSIGWEDWREDEGELLWPERFPASVVERDKRALGPIAVACQFQQSPIPRGGNIFKRDDWRLWEGAKFPAMDLIVASLDTAFTAKKANDPSAMTIWGLWREHGREGEAPKLMLMWAWRKWLEFQGSELPRENGESEKEWLARVSPEWGLLEWVIWSCRKFRVSALLIENSAAGLPLAQELQRRVMRTESWGVRLIKPQGDKRSRAEAIQPLFANGLIFAPDKEWAEMVITEMMNFRGLPSDRDDLSDSTTQVLKWLRDQQLLSFRDEEIADEFERSQIGEKSGAIYPV